MSKEIKDYLHLYLGCEVMTLEGQGRLAEITRSSNCSDRVCIFFKYTVCKIYEADGSHDKVISNAHHYYFGSDDIKPILRPLSKMKKKENKELAEIIGLDTDKEVHIWTPDQFVWLLKKGFDLFGLIESGLAIDKTKTPQP